MLIIRSIRFYNMKLIEVLMLVDLVVDSNVYSRRVHAIAIETENEIIKTVY